MHYKHSCASEPSSNAQREKSRRNEGRARSQAHNLDCSEASPTETLYVSVPKLNENEVLVPGSPALLLNIDLSGGHENNFQKRD